MNLSATFARSELILGGQRSGKSRRAERLAQGWLAQSPGHRAVLIATGQPWDDEMRQRIACHQQDRAERVPGMSTVEEPLQLAQAITAHGYAQTLVVVDCLTMWLTNWLMPVENSEENKAVAQYPQAPIA
ncbi:MAG: bifunctional adenosylcobinamide kinase/adenosylcobinamide-phosphate guanylyltransferase, partial [Polaromonas sp.]|nr:bifunctional adenosylcobinamide kinase/adenosylcobinamide-phosphate guanylyltransferase [Polaromonas sp.]